MEKGGSKISPKLYLKFHQKNHRGVFTCEHINNGEELLFVPKDQILRFDHTINTENGKIIEKAFREATIGTS